jgi:uncharacterized membrane protein
MLDFPRVIVTKLVSEFDLAQGVLIELVLVTLFPGARQLQLIEYAELHSGVLPLDLSELTRILLCEIRTSIAGGCKHHALLP